MRTRLNLVPQGTVKASQSLIKSKPHASAQTRKVRELTCPFATEQTPVSPELLFSPNPYGSKRQSRSDSDPALSHGVFDYECRIASNNLRFCHDIKEATLSKYQVSGDHLHFIQPVQGSVNPDRNRPESETGRRACASLLRGTLGLYYIAQWLSPLLLDGMAASTSFAHSPVGSPSSHPHVVTTRAPGPKHAPHGRSLMVTKR